MVFLLVFFIFALQVESSIKIPLRREISNHSRQLMSLPTEDYPISNESDTNYILLAILSIGTPPKEFRLMFNLDQNNMILEKENCVNCGKIFENKYNTLASSTYQDMHYMVSINNSIFGKAYETTIEFGKDHMEFGNYDFDAYLGLITWPEIVNASETLYDGHIGFSLYNSGYGFPSFIDSLKSAGIIKKRIFAVYINRIYQDNSSEFESCTPSNIEIGDYDLDTYSSTGEILITIPVTIEKGWGIGIIDIYLDKYKVDVKGEFLFNNFLEMIFANKTDYYEIVNYIESSNEYNCTLLVYMLRCFCDDASTLPVISFKYNGVSLMINQSVLWAKEDSYWLLKMLYSDDQYWYIGYPILYSYYTIFDMDNKEISLAPIESNINIDDNDDNNDNGDDGDDNGGDNGDDNGDDEVEVQQPFFKNSARILLTAALSLLVF